MRFGATGMDNLRLGASDVDRVYFGSSVAWERQSTPTQPVTTGMTVSANWTTHLAAYNTLSLSTALSFRISDLQISDTYEGIICESGGTGAGIILYQTGGVIYLQSGNGASFGEAADRGEVSWTVPTGTNTYTIEGSGDSAWGIILYVDFVEVGRSLFAASELTGTAEGTVRTATQAVPANRGGFGVGHTLYPEEIAMQVFNGQTTSDIP